MGQARKASSIHKIPRSDDSPTMKLSFFLLRKYAISSQNSGSGITSYPTMQLICMLISWIKDLMLLLEQWIVGVSWVNILVNIWLSQTNQKWHFTSRYPFQVSLLKKLSSRPHCHRRQHLRVCYCLSAHHHLKRNIKIEMEADYYF